MAKVAYFAIRVRHIFELAKVSCRKGIGSAYTNGFSILNCLGAKYDLVLK